ncbi:MAG: hypothetical protein WCJ19_05260 [bacterium]
MENTYKTESIFTDDEDIEFIYQGISYYNYNKTSSVTVKWTLSKIDMEGDIMYIAEIDKIIADILIEDENISLHLKQGSDGWRNWKISIVGFSTPDDWQPDHPLSIIFNMDKRTIDVIFGK